MVRIGDVGNASGGGVTDEADRFAAGVDDAGITVGECVAIGVNDLLNAEVLIEVVDEAFSGGQLVVADGDRLGFADDDKVTVRQF